MRKDETTVERILFGSRWLVAPIYVGLIFPLVMLLWVFAREVTVTFESLATTGVDEAVISALRFIDIALIANLLLIVILAGYENFVSKIDTADHEDRPAWMGTIGFADLKLKLFSSIVAITGIELLKAFMAVRGPEAPDSEALMWLIIVHCAFLLTTFFSALTDWLSSRAKSSKA